MGVVKAVVPKLLLDAIVVVVVSSTVKLHAEPAENKY